MDPSRALLALDELAKWRERKRRVGARLRTVRDEKQVLLRELDAVSARIVQLNGQLSVEPSAPPVRPTMPPPLVGVFR